MTQAYRHTKLFLCGFKTMREKKILARAFKSKEKIEGNLKQYPRGMIFHIGLLQSKQIN